MLAAILRSLRTGVVTTRYPEQPSEPPPRFRGAPRIRPGAAFETLAPPSVCPTGAISVSDSGYSIDIGRCVFCGQCVRDSPDSAIEMGREFELSARDRRSLIVEVERNSDGHAAQLPSLPPDDHIAAQIRGVLGHSLHLRHLDSGSCNACDWERAALLNPVYDIRRLGIDFVASPRHADGVMVTGPVTRNLETAVHRTFEAVPEPRIVIAVGACATSGGIVGRSYASAGGLGEVLPVDVFIPGCPPRPESIIFGILLAVGRLRERIREPQNGC